MYNRDYSEILGSSSRRFSTKGIGITLEMLDGHAKFVLNKRSESAGKRTLGKQKRKVSVIEACRSRERINANFLWEF